MILKPSALWALIAVMAGTAHAASPALAVMPFRDLSGGRGSVGEAIRETVTTDLREVAGLRLVERAAIDKIITEQGLAAKKTDLDQIGAVRVGTLVGASLIVIGAYQRAGDQVRLTARIVKVESGEILASAKEDGTSGDLFAMEDRLTGRLLVAAGLGGPPKRARPKLKSWKAVELYGDAVALPDGEDKRKLLKAVADEDPNFVYAARDLAALEKRIGAYGAASSVALAKDEQKALAEIGKLAATARAEKVAALVAADLAARRYHALERIASRLVAQPPAQHEAALYGLFMARDGLHKRDLALQTGERFLRELPSSPHFREVETRMREIVDQRKRRAARKAEYDTDLAEKLQGMKSRGIDYDYSPCIVARWNDQVNEVMDKACSEFLRKYAATATSADDKEKVFAARFFVLLARAETGDFAYAKPEADKLLAETDAWTKELRALLSVWPSD
jgi:TolB-like protein